MSFNDFAKSMWNRFRWTLNRDRFGESKNDVPISNIDVSERGERSITTLVDCYITGEYVDDKGRRFQIKQRYSIHVKYSSSTLKQAMDEVRQMIVSDFEKRYGLHGFNIVDVFVPSLIMPRTPLPIGIVKGGRAWRMLTRLEQRDFEVTREQQLFDAKIKSIMRRYNIKE